MTPSPTESPVVLTRHELIAALQNEVRIVRHLASKIDRSQLDYQPTPGQPFDRRGLASDPRYARLRRTAGLEFLL